ncbi:MAG: phenylalanine--tRNA ligase subunit beta [Candidatus Micrarchaeota archaeon]|nr:phenylalanine--tRNA ligase subunit beta [Candidatus Micrarchaeota archaeon]
MVNVTFNKNYLFKLLGFRLDDKKLAMHIEKMGFEVEASTKEEVGIALPANRPDVVDIVGFARALKNFMHKSKKLKYLIKGNDPALEIEVGGGIEGIRPFIAGMVVKGMKFDEQSLKHLLAFTEKFASNYGRNRRRLAIGLHNLDQISGMLTYDAVKDEEFLALNVSRKMKFSEILKKNEKGIAYAGTIGDSKLYPVLKDASGAISLVPILNSERTKVTASTKNLLIEITGTSRYIVEKSADLFAAMFIDLGAEVQKIKVSYKGSSAILPKMSSASIEIPLIKIEGQIGVIIGFNNVISLANKMGYEAALVGRNIRFRVPEYRLDILNEQDIIEDVAIAYGYDYIQPVPIYSEQMGEIEDATKRSRELSEVMVGLGFSEMLNSYLTNERQNFDSMRLKDHDSKYVRVKDAKMQKLTMLRTSLLPSLLGNIGMSVHEKMPQRIFELDLAFGISDRVEERQMLACVVTDPKSNFNQIKAVVQAVLQSMRIEWQVKENLHRSFIEGRCASVILKGKTIGVFGELHPEVLGNFGIEEPTIAFEISL